MSIDIEQFHSVFFEESQEHLDNMEQLLMALDVDVPDAEQLNSIFRAAHSIKGGSGIFGFDALGDVTHVMENLLDKARNGVFSMTVETVDLLLEIIDVLKQILEAYRDQSALPEQRINDAKARLEAALAIQQDPASPASETTASSSDDFGFFEHDETVAKSDDDDAFGFFESDVTDKHPPVDVSNNENDGFGFFETAENTDTPVQSVSDDFGFFDAGQKASAASSKAPQAKATVSPIKRDTAQKESSSIRVDTAKIDAMVNQVGELVITQSMLSLIGEQIEGALGEKLQTAISELQRNTREIQESAMSMRMLPINMTFNRFPRVVRDLSSKLNKQVTLKIEGGATEIDKCMIEKLVDPLTHLVRNSIDHGIEMPEVREQSGKAIGGTVVLRAEQKGGSIVISIIDDGAGLSRQRILAKAAENGLSVSEDMPDSDVWQLIFEPGFSTAAEVTDVSGRGVGMDVVRRNIEALGGRIDIESIAGNGSAFHIHLPLTLAIVDGISVSIGEQIFVVPLANIIESIQPTEAQLKRLGNDTLLYIRDQYWPLIAIHELMDVDDAITDPTQGIVVLLESGKQQFGIQVDSLLGQQQVVIKSLEQHYRKVPGISGATIMGDGKVAMILDADAIANQCRPDYQEEMQA
ncbi:chemotaxis protein CheA [Salinimonas sp. HHU 13199]|uniref:Chemotaxis protein CheA n=1 Tax=Salinimonas profundi TaxID=2729140 RepID=A0ABR8LJ92_9ALTE|nr:chemotaxis protein CheW [Salinimonas profundi]MBD3586289.1 chemotaxis protein CheA [Salinimonas profundi]